MRRKLRNFLFVHLLAAMSVGGYQHCVAQQMLPVTSDASNRQSLDELNRKLDRMTVQLEESLAEIRELRNEVQALNKPASASTARVEDTPSGIEALREQVAAMRDQTDVLQSEVKQHDQTKVETVSKYPIKIGGTLLFTSFLNSGNADNFVLPIVALPRESQSPSGSLGFTASQTLLYFELRGPHVGSAQTYADVAADFWGGASNSYYAPTAGSFRLRTLHAGMNWDSQAIRFLVDRPLFSPVEPTSWLTVAEPALAWSGNLWAWLPQVEYERDFLPHHHFDLQAGVIDTSAPSLNASAVVTSPNASERSRQPGYEFRMSTQPVIGDRNFVVGASGYYSRKSYSSATHIDSWAAAADWEIPFTSYMSLTGEFYRGRSIGGLGGGAFKDYVTSDGEQYGLNAEGGWAQLKFTATPTLSAHLSFGVDNAFASDLADEDLTIVQNPYNGLAANQTALVNAVYRPRSYLLISPEFRRIASRTITGQTNIDHVFGVATGVTF